MVVEIVNVSTRLFGYQVRGDSVIITDVAITLWYQGIGKLQFDEIF